MSNMKIPIKIKPRKVADSYVTTLPMYLIKNKLLREGEEYQAEIDLVPKGDINE